MEPSKRVVGVLAVVAALIALNFVPMESTERTMTTALIVTVGGGIVALTAALVITIGGGRIASLRSHKTTRRL